MKRIILVRANQESRAKTYHATSLAAVWGHDLSIKKLVDYSSWPSSESRPLPLATCIDKDTNLQMQTLGLVLARGIGLSSTLLPLFGSGSLCSRRPSFSTCSVQRWQEDSREIPGERAGLPRISLPTHSLSQHRPVCGWLFITGQPRATEQHSHQQ